MFRRTLLSFVALAAFASPGCASHVAGPGAATPAAAVATDAPTALPVVAAPPNEGPPPAWIAELSPRGKAAAGAQIRIRFASDVVPVEALEAPDRQAALAKITIDPPLPGRFVFVTPRMVSFDAERPIPKASRIVVTLHAGLADRAGHTLDHDVSYAFRTEPVAVTLAGDPDAGPEGPRPRVIVAANVRLDTSSLAAHASLVPASGGDPIPLGLASDASPSPIPAATPESSSSFDDEAGGVYALVPDRDVPLATKYVVRIAAGVRPQLGNVATESETTGGVTTYGPLRFAGVTMDVSDGSRPLVSGDPKLSFDNDLDATSALASVTLSPVTKAGYTALSAAGRDIAINPAALEPHTAYTVTIASTLKDAFGQTLGAPATARFATEGLAPELWAPAGFSIFPATTTVALNVVTANLPGGRYRARYVDLTPERLIDRDPEFVDDLDALAGPEASWTQTAAPQARDIESTTLVPLAKTFGGPTGLLAYGVAADTSISGSPAARTSIAGAVQVTNVGVFAQWFPTGGFVRAHHLSDGTPIAGADVKIYESKPPAGGSSHLPCAAGRTDATGTLDFSAERFARCLSVATADDQAPALLAIVHDGTDWSFVRTSTYGGPLGDDDYQSWSAGAPHARGTFVSDRSLYQRGEPAYFSAIGYFETDGAIVRGSSATYAVTMTSPQGKAISLGRHAPDAFGAFSLHATIPSDADLGDWTIAATGDRGESFQGTFTVAQFKPPTFKVALALDKAVAVPGESVTATTTSTYLFGAPVEGGREHVAVTRSRSTFVPKGYESFAYGPSYEYPEEPPAMDGDVTQADVVTAADGTTSVPVAVATDLPYPADYRVDGETKDVSNLAAGDSKTFSALPSRNLIVLRGGDLGAAQTPYDFDFAVVDPNGTAVEGRDVHFTLARRVYDDATQLVEGSEANHASVHYETVAEFEAASTSGVQRLHATPGKAGEYRLRANFDGAAGEATATDLGLYVAGDDADWYRGDDKSLHVRMDKTSYRPGETATALVASPYADAEMMFAIVRNRAISRKIAHVHGSTVTTSFVVTSDMLPNAVVEAVLVRAGPSLASGVPANLKDLSREGFAPLKVALDAQYVTVTVAPASASVAPGGTQSVRLHVADRSGAPVQAELTVAVANDAILQLSGYRFPDLVRSVYADLPISTRYADNRADVKLASEHRYLEKGFGYGGGAMAGPASTRVRSNFRPVAFFDGAVRTDASGNATVSFAVPDDLTTWRVLAIALTRDARFGSADASFVATKPLVTNAILPQFARPGDTLEGGVAVTNVSAVAAGADPGDVDVEGSLSGPLSFADPAGTAVSQKTHFAGGTAGYRFAMLVASQAATDAPDARVTFKTALAGAADAFTVPLPIETEDVLESVVETGTTTGTAEVPLAIDAALPDAGGLHVTLASTLLGDTLAPLQRVLASEGGPFAFEAAARVAIAADRIALERRYGHTADVPALLATIAAQRERLRALARDDGSYAFYPHGPSDAFTSAFVAVQLAQARRVGVDVAPELSAVRRYLLSELADPAKSDPSCTSDLCLAETRLEALETLAPLGDVRSDRLSEIYALRDKMSYYERVEMARHLVRVPEWHDRGIALRDTLLAQLYETGRRAGLVTEGDYGETPVDGQSQLLDLMIETKVDRDRIDRAFTSLLAARGRDGTWGCGCDDAEAMNAVVDYAGLDRTKPSFTGSATLGSATFSQVFRGYAVTQATKDYPMSALPRGTSRLVVKRAGTGTLHYTADFDYAVRGSAPGAYQGIRIDRIVRPAGGIGDPVATFGLAAPAADVVLEAGRVFDVEDRISTDRPLEGLVVRDALPAGLEAIDTRFATNSARAYEAVADWNIDYQTIERAGVVTFAQNLQPGVYAFHYLVRTVTPGSYAWPAARASLALAPDEFGRTSAGRLTVK